MTQTGTFPEKKRHGNFMNGVTKLNAGKAEMKTERKKQTGNGHRRGTVSMEKADAEIGE
jgi:hypothetical protein